MDEGWINHSFLLYISIAYLQRRSNGLFFQHILSYSLCNSDVDGCTEA